MFLQIRNDDTIIAAELVEGEWDVLVSSPQKTIHFGCSAREFGNLVNFLIGASEEWSDEDYKSARQLADHYKVPHDPLRTRLKRWQKKHALGADFIDVANPTRRGPKTLYRVGAVQSVIDDLRNPG